MWPSRSGLCPASVVGSTNLNKEGQTLEMYMFVCERMRARMRSQCVVRFRQASQIVTSDIFLVVVCFSSYFVGVHNAYFFLIKG